MKKTNGISLFELVLALAIFGALFVVGGPFVKQFLAKNRSSIRVQRIGMIETGVLSPWRFSYAKLPSPATTSWGSRTRENIEELRAELTPHLGALEVDAQRQWTLLCDSRTYASADQGTFKCLPAGGFVLAVLPQSASTGGHLFSKGTEFVVVRNDGSHYKLINSFDQASVGVLVNDTEASSKIVITATEGPIGKAITSHIYVDNVEWKVSGKWQPCKTQTSPGVFQMSREECFVGEGRDEKQNVFPITYDYFEDWLVKRHRREWLGDQWVLTLGPALQLSPSREVASINSMDDRNDPVKLTEKCQTAETELASASACVALAAMAKQKNDEVTERQFRQKACEHKDDASCKHMAEVALNRQNMAEVSYWCRKTSSESSPVGKWCTSILSGRHDSTQNRARRR